MKIDLINSGRSPIVEPGLEALLQKGVGSGNLRGTLNVREAVLATDISFLAPPTPSKRNGDLDVSYIEEVCQQIGKILPEKATRHTVVVRSTVLPGTLRGVVVVIPTLEKYSGLKAGKDFGVAVNRSSSAKAQQSRTMTSRP